jgi:hypothetical protein
MHIAEVATVATDTVKFRHVAAKIPYSLFAVSMDDMNILNCY